MIFFSYSSDLLISWIYIRGTVELFQSSKIVPFSISKEENKKLYILSVSLRLLVHFVPFYIFSYSSIFSFHHGFVDNVENKALVICMQRHSKLFGLFYEQFILIDERISMQRIVPFGYKHTKTFLLDQHVH